MTGAPKLFRAERVLQLQRILEAAAEGVKLQFRLLERPAPDQWILQLGWRHVEDTTKVQHLLNQLSQRQVIIGNITSISREFPGLGREPTFPTPQPTNQPINVKNANLTRVAHGLSESVREEISSDLKTAAEKAIQDAAHAALVASTDTEKILAAKHTGTPSSAPSSQPNGLSVHAIEQMDSEVGVTSQLAHELEGDARLPADLHGKEQAQKESAQLLSAVDNHDLFDWDPPHAHVARSRELALHEANTISKLSGLERWGDVGIQEGFAG